MSTSIHLRARSAVLRALLAGLPVLAACGDGTGNDQVRTVDDLPVPRGTVAVLRCTAQLAPAGVVCDAAPATAPAGQKSGRRDNLHLLGGQGTYVRLTSSNVAYNGTSHVLSFDVTVQNLTTLAMATADGATRHDGGVQVFFAAPPSTVTGTSQVTVANATGQATFTAGGQDYFQYGGKIGGTDQGELGGDGILSTGEVSSSKNWQMNVPLDVTSFTFQLYVAAQTPAGAVVSAAPQVTSISPATLVPGGTATLTGVNFNATPASNAVTIGGAAATVTGGGTTSLTVTVPCAATGTVPVQVTQGGMKGAAFSHPLQGNVRTLAAGQAVIVTDPSQVQCNELSSAGGTAAYAVAVYNTNANPQTATSFAFAGDAPGGQAGGLVSARAAAERVQAAPAPGALTPGAAAALRAEQQAEGQHLRLLEMNRGEYARLFRRFGQAERLRASRAGGAAALNTPPATRTFRVANINTGSFCTSYYSVTATRVYYNGKVAIYEDDATPAALKSGANAQMASYYQKIGDQFNADMEPVIRNYFGDPLRRDAQTDNDGAVTALFTPVINTNFAGVAGFVVSCDLFPNDQGTTNTNTSSNFGEVFYAYQPTVTGTGYGTLNPDYWYWSIRATFIHETKHLASYVAHVANGYNFFEESWLEEGLARHSEEMWARDAIYNVAWKANTGYGSAGSPGSLYCDVRQTTPACNTNPRRPSLNMQRHFQTLYTFMASPTDHSPFGRTSFDSGSSFYATSWSLTRYAIDRYGASDAAFLTALTQSNTSGITNLAARAGVSKEQLLGGWALALYADDYPGLATPSADIQMPTWNFTNIFAGLHTDFGGSFPLAYPLVPTSVAFGSFAPLTVGSLSGGSVKYYLLSGTQSAAQLLKLQSTGGGAPSSDLRVAIARLQ
ncbi:MAG TPA: IPT/TIG domain-containing protein [Longimicrobium sp.]|nr:IPT/TIG domain-containing protein [Longimicrobium sp.]